MPSATAAEEVHLQRWHVSNTIQRAHQVWLDEKVLFPWKLSEKDEEGMQYIKGSTNHT